jgi:PAS domain-containing protein
MIQFITYLNWEEVFYIFSVLALLGTGIIFCYKLTKKVLSWGKSKVNYIESAFGKINAMSKEFYPNHGSSLKDDIIQIRVALEANTQLTQKISTRQRWELNNQQGPIFESDSAGQCTWANASYLSLIKRDLPFILGNGWKNIIAPEDRDRVVHAWEQCIKDGIDSEDTYLIINSDGNKVKVHSIVCKMGSYGYIGTMKII